jgi:hypothetical protein
MTRMLSSVLAGGLGAEPAGATMTPSRRRDRGDERDRQREAADRPAIASSSASTRTTANATQEPAERDDLRDREVRSTRKNAGHVRMAPRSRTARSRGSPAGEARRRLYVSSLGDPSAAPVAVAEPARAAARYARWMQETRRFEGPSDLHLHSVHSDGTESPRRSWPPRTGTDCARRAHRPRHDVGWAEAAEARHPSA